MKDVVYLSGSGRTATTMWSILLSSELGLKNLGQSRDYVRAVFNDETCSCGDPVRECFATGREIARYRNTRGKLARYAVSRWFSLKHIRHEMRGEGGVVDASKGIRHLALIMAVTRKRPVVLEFQRPEEEISASWRGLGRSEDFVARVSRKAARRRTALDVLSRIGVIRLLSFEFRYALSHTNEVLEKVAHEIGMTFTPSGDGSVYRIAEHTQHIFPPSDPRYLTKVDEIRIRVK